MEVGTESALSIKFDPRGGHNRYNCNFNFFKKWTDKMAYVLGFLYADGTVIDATSSRTQYIKFSSTDKELIENIKVVLESEHPIHVLPPHLTVHKNGTYLSAESFILRIGSRRMFNDLICFGMVPNKSLIAKFPDVPLVYLNHFIRGYFDGDGCVFIYKIRDEIKPSIVKKLSVIFTSGSIIFLEKLGKILKNQLALNHEKVYKGNGAFQLRYSTNDSLKIFKFLYKPCSERLCLQRKFNIFKNYFERYPHKIDSEIASILEKLS